MATEVLPELVLQNTSDKPELHLSAPLNTLPGIHPELIGEIASYLNSADLHSLRNTTKWLAANVDHYHNKRRPTHTICRNVQELPRILNQLATPAVYRSITHLTLTGSMSDKPYPEIRHMFKLPRLNTLVLKDVKMDGISTVQTISYHKGTLKNLHLHHVDLGRLRYWEAIMFMIMVNRKLETFQAEGLYYSTFHCPRIEIYTPLPDLIDGLEAIRGRQAITKWMENYFRGPFAKVDNFKRFRCRRVFLEADEDWHDDM